MVRLRSVQPPVGTREGERRGPPPMHTTTRDPDLDTTTVETTGSGTDTAPRGTIREEFDIGLEPAWITDDEETSPTGPESSADRRGDRRGHPSGRTGDQHLEPVEGGETEVGPRSGAIARNTYPDEALRWKPGIGHRLDTEAVDSDDGDP